MLVVAFENEYSLEGNGAGWSKPQFQGAMDPKLKKNIQAALQKDDNRNREHQETCGLRLTKEQMEYLITIRKKFGLGRGAYMRRLLVIDMERKKFRDTIINTNTNNLKEI